MPTWSHPARTSSRSFRRVAESNKTQAGRRPVALDPATVVVFERSGHFPWIEEPDEFFDTITSWLRAHDIE